MHLATVCPSIVGRSPCGRLVGRRSAAAWLSGVCHLGVSSASGYPVGSSVGRGLAHRRVGPLAGQPTGGAVRWRVGPRAGRLAGGWPAECLSDGAGQPGVGPLAADWVRVGWAGLAGHRVARLGPDSRGRLRLRSLSRGLVSLGSAARGWSTGVQQTRAEQPWVACPLGGAAVLRRSCRVAE